MALQFSESFGKAVRNVQWEFFKNIPWMLHHYQQLLDLHLVDVWSTESNAASEGILEANTKLVLKDTHMTVKYTTQ